MSTVKFRLLKIYVRFIVVLTLILMLLEVFPAFGIAASGLTILQVVFLSSIIISVIACYLACRSLDRQEQSTKCKQDDNNNGQGPSSFPSAQHLANKKCGLNISFRGPVKFFSTPSEKLRAVRELRKAVESIYELEGKHQTDMSGFARLRICYNQDQHFLNVELKKVRDDLMSRIKILKTSSVAVQAKKYEISSKFNELEDAEEKLQMLQNELRRHELPDIQIDTLTISDMIELTKQIHDYHLAREAIHNEIIKAATEILDMRIAQYSAAQTFVTESKSIINTM